MHSERRLVDAVCHATDLFHSKVLSVFFFLILKCKCHHGCGAQHLGQSQHTLNIRYAHGRNKLRFEYAVFMLNVNIGQLLAHCGIRPVPGASTLGNLHVLFRHFLSLNHAHNGQVFPPQVQQPPQPAAPPAQHQAQTMQAPVQAPMQAQAPMHMGTVPT